MKITDKYVFFWGTNDIYSQWHPCQFSIAGRTFNCAEQWMMFCKARFFNNEDIVQKIMDSTDPREQKAFGRQVRNFDEAKWKIIAKDIVYKGNEAKFSQNPHLLEQLLDTGDRVIVEASPYDPLWGIGLRDNDPRALDPKQWKGLNWLGEVLTKLRDDLKNSHKEDQNIHMNI